MNNTCLEFGNLSLGYQGHAAVHHLSGDVKQGSLTAVAGANGSGKSSLLRGIASIFKPISGACVPGLRHLAYMAQQSERDLTFPARVIDLVRSRRPAVSSAVSRSPRRSSPLTTWARLRIPDLWFCWSPTTAYLAENISMRFIDLGGAGGKAA